MIGEQDRKIPAVVSMGLAGGVPVAVRVCKRVLAVRISARCSVVDMKAVRACLGLFLIARPVFRQACDLHIDPGSVSDRLEAYNAGDVRICGAPFQMCRSVLSK